MRKIKKIINILSLGVVLYAGFILWQNHMLIEVLKLGPKLPHTTGFYVNEKFDDNYAPEFLKKYLYKGKNEEIKKLQIGSLGRERLYDERENQRMLTMAFHLKPSNYEELIKEIPESVMNLTKQLKKTAYPSYEESRKLPAPPSFNTMRLTGRYFANLATLLDFEDYQEAALMLPYSLYYTTREIELNNEGGGSILTQTYGNMYSNFASQEIVNWASKPRKDFGPLCKYLAKDILELVEKNIPLSRGFETESYYLDKIFSYLIKKGNLVALVARYSGIYKNANDFYIGVPLTFVDKPKYQIIKEINNFDFTRDKRATEILENGNKKRNNSAFFKPCKFLTEFVFTAQSPYTRRLIEGRDKKLAYMELAAIALVYNSYYTEHNKIPESMKELEDWFGQPLPIDRISGKAYELNPKEGYTLFCPGFDNKEDDYSDNYSTKDDLLFKFTY